MESYALKKRNPSPVSAKLEVSMHDITRRSALKLTMAAAATLGGIAGMGLSQHAMAEETGRINVSDHQRPSFGSLSAYIYPSFYEEQYGEGAQGQTYDAFYLGDDFFAVATHYEVDGTNGITSEEELEGAVNTYLLNDDFILSAPIEKSDSYGFQRVESTGDSGAPFIAYQAGPYVSSSDSSTTYLMSYAFCGQGGELLVISSCSPWGVESLSGPGTYCVTGSVDCVTGEPSSLQAPSTGTGTGSTPGTDSAAVICNQHIDTEEGDKAYAFQWDTEQYFLTVDGGYRTVKHLFLTNLDHAPTGAENGRYITGFIITSGNHCIFWSGVIYGQAIGIDSFWYKQGVRAYPVAVTSYDIDGFHWFGFDPIEGDFRIS